MQLIGIATIVATLLLLCRQSAGQVCPAGRSASTRQFGFARSAGQGVNDSYLYLAFVHDVTGPGTASPIECNGIAGQAGMQRVEAGLWAVANFRARYPALLPSVTLGALILDACQSSLLPVQLLSNLQSCETVFGDVSGSVDPRNTAAYIGVSSMTQAVDAFSLTNWTAKATVTYDLTSSLLNRASYPLLARVSPSDLAELDAICQVLRSLGVSYVQLVHSSATVQGGRYSTLADVTQSRLSTAGVCIVNRVAFDVSTAAAATAAAASVAAFPRIRPVLLLMTTADLTAFSDQMLALMPSSGTFTWMLTSEQWSSASQIVLGRQNFFSGAVAIAPSATATYPDYLTYFRSLRPDMAGHSVQNPWLGAFWSANFRCNLPGGAGTTYTDTCNYAAQNLQPTAAIDPSATRVIQSVDLTLHAIELTRRASCGDASVGLCDAFRSDPNRYRIVYSNLYNAKSLGYADVELDSITGAAAKYTLLVQNYQKTYPGNTWTQIGAYQSGSLSVASQAQAYGMDERNTTWAPSGVCDAGCLTRCPSNGTTTATTTREVASTISTQWFTGTTGLDLSQMRYRKQYWVYALVVCASVGIIVTLLFMVYILFKVLGLPSELKSFNTLWSGQFLLFIILIGYVFLFAWIPWPGIESCGIIRFMLGFEYAAVFSILMVKLLNLMNDQLTSIYQVLMFILGLGVQIAINVEWLILVPIGTVLIDGTQRCDHTFEHHLLSLVYCMALILLCTCLAVRAHSIGRNNRESIFVGCTAGVSIPIWIAWGLVGSLNQDPEVKDASLAFGLLINLTLVLLVIFLPKIQQLRRLENEDSNNDVVDVAEDDAYDLDDPFGKEPIYMLTQGAPSIISESGGIAGQIYLASPDLLALPSPLQSVGSPPFYYAARGARSLQGEPPVGGLNGATRSVTVGSMRPTPRKAYSDYNPSGEGARRPPSGGSDRREGGGGRAAPSPDKETKTQRLAKLGFL